MKNMYGSEDLLKCKGAKVCAIEYDGIPVNGIFIPSEWNDIKIKTDQTGAPNHAYLSYNLWVIKEEVRQDWIAKNADNEKYKAPRYNMNLNFSEDFQKRAQQSAEKRLRSDKYFMSNNPTEEQILERARLDVMNAKKIGYVYEYQPKEAPSFTGQAPVAAAGGWTPPAVDEDGHVVPGDDLPF